MVKKVQTLRQDGALTFGINRLNVGDGFQNGDEGDVISSKNADSFVHIYRMGFEQMELGVAIKYRHAIWFHIVLWTASRLKYADETVLGQNRRKEVVEMATFDFLQTNDVRPFDEDLLDDQLPTTDPFQGRGRMMEVKLALMADQISLRQNVE